ncbi:hypothetical protein [Azospirillum sp. ST 5-10]|uniref:hypothetical protein n=1 Tax=unclassified Azospirillum TaxID=2630922 RepID=UPI003F4A607B
MQTLPDAARAGLASPAVGIAADEAAERLAAYLAGVPHDLRDAALQGYRRVTLALLARRGVAEGAAEALVDGVVAKIRARLGAIDRAGGTAVGRA